MKPNPIQYQAAQLCDTLFAPDTALTYKEATLKSGEILKQTARLIFMLGLLFVVFVVWVWSVGFQSGQGFRGWLETEQPTLERLLQEAAKILLKPFELVAEWSQSQVKELLGIPEDKVITPATDCKVIEPAVEKKITEV